ncbi:hypothetical protein BH10ACI3_BH10ACI3_09390 [soil metagenome]
MFQVSKASPAYYLTSVTKDRLPVFRTNTISEITCKAIDEARRSGNFLIFAYVVMLEHIHLVTDSSRNSKDIHRFVNGIISRRVIDYLKTNGHEESLMKLRISEQADGYKYSLWQHHPDTRLLWNEEMLRQRINYTHLNPVSAELVEHPDEWSYSSSRIWHRRPNDVEPLLVDIDKIAWRKS